jgi:hypothetical protein
VIPGLLTLICLGVLYAARLERRLGKPQMSPGARALTLLILAFAVFWDTERIARVMGAGYPTQMAAEPTRLVAVTVYSPKDLHINAPGVVETRLGETDAAYLYKYEGLRLVQRSGNRYFLITDQWDVRHPRVLLLRESDTIRLEFSRDRESLSTP